MVENNSRVEVSEGLTANDEDFIRSAQRGDRSAFERLYRVHVGRVYAVCLRMSGEASLAEDLTQEVFIRTWKKLGSFQHKSSFSSWLHRLAVNVILDHRRQSGRRRINQLEEEEELATMETASTRNPVNLISLERAIAALPSGARTVFVLHDIEGYAHNEIANLTRTAPGTTKAQLHRARQILRGILGK
jgi:RNA polymerase sigma-70 factor, ECF subfamily